MHRPALLTFQELAEATKVLNHKTNRVPIAAGACSISTAAAG